MLPDQVTQLLTAYVDGELSQRQRKAVMRVLHRSSEAREFLRQLQENAHKIKRLPRRNVSPSLVNEIVQAIAEQNLQPTQSAARKAASRRWLPYVAGLMAASVLVAAIGLLTWKALEEDRQDFADNNNNNNKDNKTTIEPAAKKTGPGNDKKTDANSTKKTESPSEKKVEPQPPPRRPNPLLAKLVEDTYRGFGAPVGPAQPFAASFAELKDDASPKAGRLTHELQRERISQLDITVKNNSVAVERLRSALHDKFITVVVDPDASKALKRASQKKLEYLVYAENMTPTEVGAILKELSKNDTTGNKNEPTPYERLRLAAPTYNDKARVGRVLGIDLNKLDKEQSGPIPERWKRKVLVLPVSSGAQPSEEIRRFGLERPKPQAGTVQLLIRIHQD